MAQIPFYPHPSQTLYPDQPVIYVPVYVPFNSNQPQNKRKWVSRNKDKKHSRRLVWDGELQRIFLEAVEFYGDDVVPNQILKYILRRMKDVSLTREQVSSHLQKYKIKQIEEAEERAEEKEAAERRKIPKLKEIFRTELEAMKNNPSSGRISPSIKNLVNQKA